MNDDLDRLTEHTKQSCIAILCLTTVSISSMSAADLKPFQIRLSLKGNVPKLKSIQSSKPNHIISIDPQMSMAGLLNLSHKLFGVPKGKNYSIELYSGFPPKMVDLGRAGGGRASLVTANGISGGEAMTVNIVKNSIEKNSKAKSKQAAQVYCTSSGNENVNGSVPLPLQSTESQNEPIRSESSTTSSRPKRASAQAATDSFKEVIRAQDKMINSERKKKTSAKPKSEPSTAQIAAREKATDARAVAANSRKMAALPGGRRMDNDEPPNAVSPSVDSSLQRKTRNKSNSLFKGLGSEDDISFALISSLDSGSKGKGKVSKVLRASMKKTVEKSYEASRAVVRHSAIASRKVIFSQSANQGENTNNSTGTIHVKYPKSIEGRGNYEEVVHIITALMLKAVVQAVYDDHDENDIDGESASGREMLKPNNMALLSPRVFWSLWYHYHNQCASIEQALEILLPDLDWKFLYRRSRQLSEKAKDNLLQEQKQEEPTRKAEAKNTAAGIRAVEAVEKAMETMYDEAVVNVRERAAHAALARFGQADCDEWEVQTPTDVDEDEIKDCIAACPNGCCDLDSVLMKCIRVLQAKLSIHNWRELANAVPAIVQDVLRKEGIEAEAKTVEAWISEAQTRSIEEIMLEIIDGDQDLYEILRDELSSATPIDLALWASVPALIIEESRSQIMVSENDLRKYCLRARKTIETLQWLEKYSTSISNST